MLKVLILDDDENTREFFKKLVVEVPGVTEIFDTANGKAAISWAEANQPNLILLDIELETDNLNGLDVAKCIYEFNKDAYIIFITGYSQYAIDSFEVHPYSYITKPINITKFKQLIAEIVELVGSLGKSKSDILTFKSKNEVIHINTNDIIFLEAQRHRTIIYTQTGICQIRRSLDEVEKILPSKFLRIHRSFIVNIQKIKRTTEVLDRSYEIEFLDCTQKAHMSRHYYSKYKECFDIK